MTDQMVPSGSRRMSRTCGCGNPSLVEKRSTFPSTIAWQTISSGVSSNRKLFGAVLRAGKDNEDEDGDRSLHGGDIIATKSHKRHKVFYRRVTANQQSFMVLLCLFGR